MVGMMSLTEAMVHAALTADCISASWSMSCSDPRPLRIMAVAPEKTSKGLWASCAFLTAVSVLVSPGPAVTMATPGTPVRREMASAAKTVVASSRTSTTRIPTASQPTRIGAMWPPVSVKTKRTPCSRQAWAASRPPYCTEDAGPVSAADEAAEAVSHTASAGESVVLAGAS